MRIATGSSWFAIAVLLMGPNRTHAPSRLAAPGVIVFSGGPLTNPIVLSDWAENQRLMMAAVPAMVSDSELAHRAKIDVAMYWGGEWSRFAVSPDSRALLRRMREAQPGAYYPAAHLRPAVWIFGPMGAMRSSRRHLGAEGVAILRAHHLPVAPR